MLGRIALVTVTLALAGACDVLEDTTTKDGIPTVDSTTTPVETTEPTTDDACTAPRYGDGTCDLDLPCDAPDIDCFVVFDNKNHAGKLWFADFEALLAEQASRPPRALLGSDDPRFVRMRGLLDQGWAAYQQTFAVGALAAESPALVLIDDPVVQAFVAPDIATGKAGFAVMVHSGLMDAPADDEEVLGVVMHELQHAVGLHIVGDVADSLTWFYLADGHEPLGWEQSDDPLVREYGEQWIDLSDEFGDFTEPRLGGLPLRGLFGDTIFASILDAQVESHPRACAGPVEAYDELVADLMTDYDPITSTLDLPPETPDRITAVLADLRDRCITEEPTSFVDLVAASLGLTPDDLSALLGPDVLAIVDGQHVVDGMEILIDGQRTDMRDLESVFEDDTSVPWTGLRFHTTEEAADDATVPVLFHAGMKPDALGDFFLNGLMVGDEKASCDSMLHDAETPPYGGLVDIHHTTCWRTDHLQHMAEDPEQAMTPPAAKRISRARRQVIPDSYRPKRLKDLIMY